MLARTGTNASLLLGSGLGGALARIAEAEPHREVCGLVTASPGGDLQVEPVRNVASGRHAFTLDPGEQLRLLLRLRAEGGRVVAVYHSHVDGPARPSAEDGERSVVGGLPVLPGADWIVIGMRSGKTQEIRIFTRSGSKFSDAGPLPFA